MHTSIGLNPERPLENKYLSENIINNYIIFLVSQISWNILYIYILLIF